MDYVFFFTECVISEIASLTVSTAFSIRSAWRSCAPQFGQVRSPMFERSFGTVAMTASHSEQQILSLSSMVRPIPDVERVNRDESGVLIYWKV